MNEYYLGGFLVALSMYTLLDSNNIDINEFNMGLREIDNNTETEYKVTLNEFPSYEIQMSLENNRNDVHSWAIGAYNPYPNYLREDNIGVFKLRQSHIKDEFNAEKNIYEIHNRSFDRDLILGVPNRSRSRFLEGTTHGNPQDGLFRFIFIENPNRTIRIQSPNENLCLGISRVIEEFQQDIGVRLFACGDDSFFQEFNIINMNHKGSLIRSDLKKAIQNLYKDVLKAENPKISVVDGKMCIHIPKKLFDTDIFPKNINDKNDVQIGNKHVSIRVENNMLCVNVSKPQELDAKDMGLGLQSPSNNKYKDDLTYMTMNIAMDFYERYFNDGKGGKETIESSILDFMQNFIRRDDNQNALGLERERSLLDDKKEICSGLLDKLAEKLKKCDNNSAEKLACIPQDFIEE